MFVAILLVFSFILVFIGFQFKSKPVRWVFLALAILFPIVSIILGYMNLVEDPGLSP